MQTLIFATNNKNKVLEMNAIAAGRLHIISLREAGIHREIPEPYHTLRQNAHEKCRVIAELTGQDCFSEDTGLEVDALGGAPGVFSARYAGEGCTAAGNINKLLAEMDGKQNRQARFRTVICLMAGGETHYFEGVCEGHIITAPRGTEGFGYDPVFVPEGGRLTFAEMGVDAKKTISHRKKAFDKLFLFLNRYNP